MDLLMKPLCNILYSNCINFENLSQGFIGGELVQILYITRQCFFGLGIPRSEALPFFILKTENPSCHWRLGTNQREVYSVITVIIVPIVAGLCSDADPPPSSIVYGKAKAGHTLT